jgi:hypothetical protein
MTERFNWVKTMFPDHSITALVIFSTLEEVYGKLLRASFAAAQLLPAVQLQ